jgi:hypothetical protein
VRLRLTLLAAMLMSIVVSMSGGSVGTGGADQLVPQAGWHQPAGDPADAPQPLPLTEPPVASGPPTLNLDARVSVEIDGFLTWAALDRTTGRLVSSSDRTSTTESMIKPWIVADHLRRVAEAGREPTEEELDHARRAIRYSDNLSAEALYLANGADAVVRRMIDMCGLTDTTVFPGWWSRTELTAADAVRMGECIANGTAAGPEWTDWVLEEMRHVEGTTAPEDQRPEAGFEGGRWGIIDGLPPSIPVRKVAIKNGWTRVGATNSWHVACLAIHEDWVLAVLMRYPASLSLDYGAERCAGVAQQLFTFPAAQAR